MAKELLNNINLEDLKKIAISAGNAIMDIYKSDFSVAYKEDNSPLTLADIKSNQIICSSLIKLYPKIPILSEENNGVPYDDRKNWEYYWCIDPIDGTKEFVKKNGEFTINIALIHKNTPIIGIVYAPVIKDMYSSKKGSGAFLNGKKLPLKINNFPEKEINIVSSKSHLSEETKEFINKLDSEKISLKSVGSSLKLCMVASGEADIYPRLAPTMEWDTAAADAIVRESGKMTYQFSTNLPLTYNKENLRNPYFLVK